MGSREEWLRRIEEAELEQDRLEREEEEDSDGWEHHATRQALEEEEDR